MLTGMTSAMQKQLLKMFADKQHQVVISTSIAEEGIDIRACNLVIRYENASSEVAMIQARGT